MQVSVPFPVEMPRVTSPAGFFPAADAFYHFSYKVPWVATYGGLKYHAYRITWQDGSELGAYYGIDGMDWTHPPLFENAKTDVIGGRTYMFVTNGGHWQDIGWIQGKDLYWEQYALRQHLKPGNAADRGVGDAGQLSPTPLDCEGGANPDRHYGVHRRYAPGETRSDRRGEPRPERRALRKARGGEPGWQREGPDRARDDRGGGA